MRDESDEDAAVDNSDEPQEDVDERATSDDPVADRSSADGGRESESDGDDDDHDVDGPEDPDDTSDGPVDDADAAPDADEDEAGSDSDGDSDSNSDANPDANQDVDADDVANDSDSSADEAGSDECEDEDEVEGEGDTDSSESEDETESDTETEDEPTAKTDGEGYVHDQPSDDDPDYPDPDDDGLGGISTPPDDEEMPLADHIEEMIMRFAVVLVMASIATVVGLLWASDVIAFIWADVIPESDERLPHIYHPLELWLTRIKVSALAGILVALPVFVYQCYKFMRPGLYPNERKYYLSAVPMSLVLGLIGMFFSYILVLPVLFRYFTFYSEESAEIHYALGETFDLVITLTGFLAIVFQIPLFIMLAIMMGVTTRKWLADKRLYFWAAFFGLSFMFTMDPTLMAPIIVAIIMIILFEGTLLLLKWTGRE